MAEKGIQYGIDEGTNTISGYEKFGVKGKSFSEIRSQFADVINFLKSEYTTLRGRVAKYREIAQERENERAKKEKREAREISTKEAQEEYYAEPEKFDRHGLIWREIRNDSDFLRDSGGTYDSHQINDMVSTVAQSGSLGLTIEELEKKVKDKLAKKKQEAQEKYRKLRRSASDSFK